MYLDQQSRQYRETERQRAQNTELVGSGAVSALDLRAPSKAVDLFNNAVSLLRPQKLKEASSSVNKAIVAYSKFVSAHLLLGQIYFDQDDLEHAKDEFETAAKLDEKFPRSFLNLGVVAISLRDFSRAESYLQNRIWRRLLPSVPRTSTSFLRWLMPKMQTSITSKPWLQHSKYTPSIIRGRRIFTT